MKKQNASLVNGPELCWENFYETKLDNSQVSDISDITHIAKNQKHLQDFDDKDKELQLSSTLVVIILCSKKSENIQVSLLLDDICLSLRISYGIMATLIESNASLLSSLGTPSPPTQTISLVCWFNL